MTDFLDVRGASGTVYRFRRSSLSDLPVGAGNLLAVTGSGSSRTMFVCATARSLTRAAQEVRQALTDHPQAVIYVRLNVARATREAEHADIVAASEPAKIFEDLG